MALTDVWIQPEKCSKPNLTTWELIFLIMLNPSVFRMILLLTFTMAGQLLMCYPAADHIIEHWKMLFVIQKILLLPTVHNNLLKVFELKGVSSDRDGMIVTLIPFWSPRPALMLSSQNVLPTAQTKRNLKVEASSCEKMLFCSISLLSL